MNLPSFESLPIQLLSSCFNKKSTTYKFYWFLSILQEVENGNVTILKKDVFSRMISNAWYTVNYFHISFGKQDVFEQSIQAIQGMENIPIDANKENVFQQLSNTQNKEVLKILKHFDKNVPHWFMSTWFPKSTKYQIYNQSQTFSNDCLYALYEDKIIINERWLSYLFNNVKVLKDFCYWNLTLYLQARNPNVPDIPNKLLKPAVRSSLLNQRRRFWDIIIEEKGFVKCIYTGENLTVDNYAVEHFIPYSFVSHDLIWNLIPAQNSFNSIKSDKLPPLEKYFDGFYDLQKNAIEIISRKNPKNKFLEDYLTIFPDLNNISKERFRERVQPLITIAHNNGFEFLL